MFNLMNENKLADINAKIAKIDAEMILNTCARRSNKILKITREKLVCEYYQIVEEMIADQMAG